ncbi:40S ribosomal subunit biogenesis [Komagataella phaffii CBS 7435]|uniref:U3 small nucleolar RNA-associated protein 25 n=2 Tax=Komagataella phaffii TaxID=460519 RepID=UTP25_KOMPG|nr:Protein required for cell viability [Komagataella phaffii GS115]C4R2K0.1 RecName: Full=U3 small nucleolar RNA-associated protein 25; Short=U3 snoRNA-associated protein 25; AltName: Full=U three protein 25 [Komagataella phaffii GS115]AOA62469.1 GQ67_01142T0 [Komagataella phaffii]CAH2447721.1 40S ribosomal subunit biogenesis [Komagataella phaffii CBS 7435]AOA67196.1 GQ68_00247T0 [Komagataella phaffii GS115]CAY69724.1 Protein required for cell viability [Komagataella phaffii GS115]CCA37901.1 
MTEANSNRNRSKHARSHYGREELRTVRSVKRRTGGKNNYSKFTPMDNNESIVEESEDEGEEEDDEQEDPQPSSMAYDALLTLLDDESDHEQFHAEKEKALKKLEEEQEREEEELQEEDEDEDEEDEEINLEDFESDDESHDDPFHFHFNEEESIDRMINEYESSGLKVKMDRKVNHNGYNILEYLPSTSRCLNEVKTLDKLRIKKKLRDQFSSLDFKDELDKKLTLDIFNYKNINYQYYTRETDYQSLYLLHALNHLLKTRDRIFDHNNKISADPNLEFKDQGYTRPKILILLPTRNFCFNLMNKLIKLADIKTVENKKRFNTQFYSDFKIETLNGNKPKDFNEFFRGNSSDFFTLGVKFTRKSMKIYSMLKQSDIIFASPLGLKMLLDKEKNDYLSSIEVTILDKADGLLMQNWDHVKQIFTKSLIQAPKNFEELNCDFSRIRMWCINDQAKYVHQVLSFSKYTTPELNNIVKAPNLQGYALYKPIIDDTNNVMNQLNYQLFQSRIINKNIRLNHMFMRFPSSSPMESPKKRLNFFTKVILPNVLTKSPYTSGTLVYISSYLDYIQVKKHLSESRSEFLAVDEYTSLSASSKNRSLFEKGKYPIMLYTERMHFYKRYNLNGVRNVVFYNLPTDPDFYAQVVRQIVRNKLKDEELDLNLCSIKVMFDRFDTLKLEKIVGLKRASLLVNAEQEVFEFK